MIQLARFDNLTWVCIRFIFLAFFIDFFFILAFYTGIVGDLTIVIYFQFTFYKANLILQPRLWV